ncbi:exonuclease VII large subunit [Microbacterium proteolyticum]|uniref:Exonuclease VII large subunit n=1 Tax=Microbacterium proteolyticum TaxID=1572644 RepID=A0A7W5GGG2_9MICO|nr:exonuclease VII large subunit [Microbacterium proteolyticum]
MSPAKSGDEWGWPVDRRAALREAGPTLAAAMRERPGSETDRVQQEFHRALNRAASRTQQAARERHLAAVADADRFIAEMQEKERGRLAKWAAGLRDRNERRTA